MRLLCGAAIAILLGFVAITCYSLVDAWNATWQNALQSSENLTTALAHDIDRNITLYDLSLQTVVAGLKLPQLPEMSPAVRQAVLFDGSASADGFGTIFVIGEDGNIQFTSKASSAAGLRFANRDFFTVHRDDPDIGLYISAPFRFRVSGAWAVAFSRRIAHSDGSFAGIVFGSVRLDYFKRLFDRVDIGPDGTLTLIRTDGLVLMRKPYMDPAQPRIVPHFEHVRVAPSGSFEAPGQIDGRKRLFVYRKIDKLPLVVAVGPTTEAVFAEWQRKAGITVVMMLGLVVVAIWLLLRLAREYRRRAEAEARAIDSERRHKVIAEKERDARTALERSIEQVEISVREQKRAKLALSESEQRLARAQRIAGVGDIEHNLITGKVTWSDHAYDIYGLSKGQTLTWEMFISLVHPEDREHMANILRNVRQGIPAPATEYRIIRPDGSLVYLLRENELIRDATGKVVRVASTVKDITELRQSQERERELHAALQHRQKLEALGTLAGGIAHDMNNTLVPILALSKRAMTRAPTGTREHENFETIYRASEHARDLVKQILAFSRKDSIDKKPVRLGALTCEALQMMRAGLPATIALTEHIDEAPLVLGDAGQLRQVIINLVTNAAQAIGETTGTIAVRVEGGHESAWLSVSDTGCGIDGEHLPRLFDPFFTTKEAGQGTGLGLSVVHGIVTAHGGRIEVKSELGRGAAFTVVFPAVGAKDEPLAIEPAA